MEEIKRLEVEINSIIRNRNEVPTDLLKIIEEAYKGMIEKYKRYGHNNETISKYIEGKLNEIEFYLKEQFETIRQNEYVEGAEQIIRRMLNELEDEKEQEEKTRDEEKHKQEFSEIKCDNIRDTRNILSILDEALREIQSVQDRTLESRGYDKKLIEELHYEVISYITRIGIQNEEKIYGVLEKEDEEMTKDLLEEYEGYLKYVKKTKEEKFRDSLKVDTDLEEQNKTAKEIVQKMEKEKPQQTQESELRIDLI